MNYFQNIAFMIILMVSGATAVANDNILSVIGSNIMYEAKKEYFSSTSIDSEDLIPHMQPAGKISININDHFVLRTSNSKISFTPLVVSDNVSSNSVNAAKQLLKLKLPDGYLSVMTLYQHFGEKSKGSDWSNCQFLILDRLLSKNKFKTLENILETEKISLKSRNGFTSFSCPNS